MGLFKTKSGEDLLKYKKDMNAAFLDLQKKFENITDGIDHNKTYLKHHFDELKRLDHITLTYKRNIDEIYKTLEIHDNKKSDKTDMQKEFNRIQQDIKLM